MGKVFVSYQHDEKEQVFRIVDILKDATGVEVWIDRDGIFVGDQFSAVIESAIEDAAFFVMMITRKWFSSD